MWRTSLWILPSPLHFDDVLDTIDTDNITGYDDLKDALSDLEDAAMELVDGSKALSDGVDL